MTGGQATVEGSKTLQYTVSGISADHVDVVLVKASDVTKDANGQVTFKGTNLGGSGNVAQLNTPVGVTFTTVNGNSASGTYLTRSRSVATASTSR